MHTENSKRARIFFLSEWRAGMSLNLGRLELKGSEKSSRLEAGTFELEPRTFHHFLLSFPHARYNDSVNFPTRHFGVCHSTTTRDLAINYFIGFIFH